MRDVGTRLANVRELAAGLSRREPVVYADNGFRATDGKALLARLERLLPAMGISRVAELSQLSPLNFPVFQTTRPEIFSHPECGQNTGSQGKGRTVLQSKLSCLMEEVESLCAEPRAPRLVRASFETLRRRTLTIDPGRLVSCEGGRAHADEPLMWVDGWRLADGEQPGAEVLMPAEAVLFPFFPERYGTASHFPCSSNGLAAGASYLEAVIHGLYEVVERAYHAFYQRDEARVSALPPEVVAQHVGAEALALLGGEQAVQLLTLELPPARRDLPMLICLIHTAERSYAGYGCSSTVEISIARALSEALQAHAVDISGSREDLQAQRPTTARPRRAKVCDLDSYRARVIDRRFETLNEELDHLCQWLRGFGFPEIVVSNLSLTSLDIPVVKVVVPGLPCPAGLREQRQQPACVDEATGYRFGLRTATANSTADHHTPVAKGAAATARRVRVYAGLSVSAEQVLERLPAALMSPPAARGDIARDMHEGVDVVLLIDGRFQQSLAVSVGEIADALRCGVRIYGASSMGALRAAELRHCGMRPFGAIADWVASVRYFRDDYLGLRYAPEQPQLRGVAYVDVHFALRQMVAAGELSDEQGALLDACYRSLHFAERDLAGFVGALAGRPDSDVLRTLATEALARPSQKTGDAIGLLDHAADALKQLDKAQRALSRSLAGVRRFPFFDADRSFGVSLML